MFIFALFWSHTHCCLELLEIQWLGRQGSLLGVLRRPCGTRNQTWNPLTYKTYSTALWAVFPTLFCSFLEQLFFVVVWVIYRFDCILWWIIVRCLLIYKCLFSINGLLLVLVMVSCTVQKTLVPLVYFGYIYSLSLATGAEP